MALRTRVVQVHKREWKYCFSVQVLKKRWWGTPYWKEVDFMGTDMESLVDRKKYEAIQAAKLLSEDFTRCEYDSANSTPDV